MTPQDPKDWPEDKDLENGQYQSRCLDCHAVFIGHKRRVVCRACSAKSQDPKAVEEALARVSAWTKMKEAGHVISESEEMGDLLLLAREFVSLRSQLREAKAQAWEDVANWFEPREASSRTNHIAAMRAKAAAIREGR